LGLDDKSMHSVTTTQNNMKATGAALIESYYAPLSHTSSTAKH
jgi:hypothetical protein